MKRTFAVLLCLALAFSVVACAPALASESAEEASAPVYDPHLFTRIPDVLILPRQDAPVEEPAEEGEPNPVPLGYLETVRVFNTDVILGGDFEASAVDVTAIGEYKIIFRLTVDPTAYEQAQAAILAGPQGEETPLPGSIFDVFEEDTYRATYAALAGGEVIVSGSYGDTAAGLQQTLVDLGQDITVDGGAGPLTMTALNEVRAVLGFEEKEDLDAAEYIHLLQYLIPQDAGDGLSYAEAVTEEDNDLSAVETARTVRVVEPEDYQSMLEEGAIREVTEGISVVALPKVSVTSSAGTEPEAGEPTQGEAPANDNDTSPSVTSTPKPTATPKPTSTPKPGATPNPDAPTGPQNTDPNTTPEPVNDDVDPTPAPNPDAPTGPQDTDPNTTPEPVKDDVDPTPAPAMPKPTATPTPATPKPTATPTPETPKPTATPTPETPKPTATPHSHTWVTENIPEKGHYETRQTGTKQVEKSRTYTDTVWVSTGWEPTKYVCNNCGAVFYDNVSAGEHSAIVCESTYSSYPGQETGHYDEVEKTETYYEDEPVYEDVWVVDVPSSSRTYCSECGATK